MITHKVTQEVDARKPTWDTIMKSIQQFTTAKKQNIALLKKSVIEGFDSINETRSLVNSIPCKSSIRSIDAFSNVVVLGTEKGTLIIKHIADQQLMHFQEIEAHEETIFQVKIVEEDLRIITSSKDKLIKIWKDAPASGYFLAQEINAHQKAVFGIAVSINGNLIISASEDHRIKLWGAEDSESKYNLMDEIFES